MAEAIFNYEGCNTTIQCKINQKMKDIIGNFLNKIQVNSDNLFYLYNGNEIDKELSFIEQANDLDKNRKKMNIVVNKNSDDINAKKELISKDIICPECKENILLDFENYKINLKGCKNNYKINNILFKEFEETQKIDISQIICDICKLINKNTTHDNVFYFCNTCSKKMCPLCESKHDKNHIIINYDDKDFICAKHNEQFTKYCETCNENLCIMCEKEHNYFHKIIDFSIIFINENELIKSSEDLKIKIDEFKYKINIIKDILDNMINKLETYFIVNKNIIDNYNIKKRNYHKLQNLYNLKNNNDKVIKDINDILIDKSKLFEINKYPFYDSYENNKGEIYIGEPRDNII